MKVLLIGANSQLGWELTRTRPDRISLTAVDYPEIDITQKDSIHQTMEAVRPGWIINTAAYTNVDMAESEPEAADQINHRGARRLAEAANHYVARMAHVSTDFVFSGRHHHPYPPDATPAPKSVYGRTKLDGEQAVINVLNNEGLIVRTAWLYSAHGNNFVKTMLKLMDEKEQLTIVADQVGTPTWAHGLARAIWTMIDKDLKGIFHWTDAGVASWYDFAVAIQAEALSLGQLAEKIPILPISTDEYPTPASRPAYSVLDKSATWQATGLTPIHWQAQLRAMLQELDK